MTRTICHVFANRINMGDYASMLGVRQTLRDRCSEDLEFMDMLLLDEVSDEDVERINSGTELVVLGGGGLLFNKPKHPLGWMWNISTERFAALKVPVVFYGVGLNEEYLSAQDWRLDKRGAQGVAWSFDRAALVGLRDYRTIAWARSLVPDHRDKVHFSPCPSLFLRNPTQERPAEDASESRALGVNVVPLAKLWKSEIFISVLVDALKNAVSEGYTISYLPHSPKPESTVERLHELLPGHIANYTDPLHALTEYSSVTSVLCMRAHSMYMAFNLGRPFLNISYNTKCESIIETLGMKDFTIPWKPLRPWERISPVRTKLRRAVSRLVEEPSRFLPANYTSMKDELCSHNNAFADRVLEIIS